MPLCSHTALSFSPSPYAASTGYTQPNRQQLATAAGLRKGEEYPPASTFPAPLVLPGDELEYDPKYPSQSFRSWLREKNRNEVTPGRRTIYIADSPRIDNTADFMRSWAQPQLGKKSQTESPVIADMITYLSAFFHPLLVKDLQTQFQFSAWSTHPSRKPTKATQKVALTTYIDTTLIRHRQCPDGLFQSQLNLNE